MSGARLGPEFYSDYDASGDSGSLISTLEPLMMPELANASAELISREAVFAERLAEDIAELAPLTFSEAFEAKFRSMLQFWPHRRRWNTAGDDVEEHELQFNATLLPAFPKSAEVSKAWVASEPAQDVGKDIADALGSAMDWVIAHVSKILL